MEATCCGVSICWHFLPPTLGTNNPESPRGKKLALGVLAEVALVQDIIAAGCTKLDLLRYTELYKFSWGGVHSAACSFTVRPPSALARLASVRDAVWLGAESWKRWLVAAE